MTESDFMLPQDKANHVIYGGGFVLLALLFVSPGWALLVGVVAAAGKEALDAGMNWWQVTHGEAPTHDPSPWDFLATFCGASAMYLGAIGG